MLELAHINCKLVVGLLNGREGEAGEELIDGALVVMNKALVHEGIFQFLLFLQCQKLTLPQFVLKDEFFGVLYELGVWTLFSLDIYFTPIIHHGVK